MNHYKTLIEISASPERVFKAISTDITSWWGEQDIPILKNGDIFTISWGEPWYQFKVRHYSKNEGMIWECTDANQIIAGLHDVQKEWVGTKIHWRLKPLKENQTILEFEHEGLVPSFICFNFCSKIWNHFLADSLTTALEHRSDIAN